MLTILALLLGLLGFSATPAQAATTITFTAEELLGKPTDNSVTINIVPAATIVYHYQYGTAPGSYSGQTADYTATGNEPHEVTLTGLAANTLVYYRMQYHIPAESDWVSRSEHSFWTQRAPDTTFSFAVTSDIHANFNTTHQNTMTNILNEHPDFLIDLGDTFMLDSLTSQTAVNNKYLAFREPLYFDKIGSSTPIFLASGNHENEEGWNFDDTPFSIALGSVLARKLYFPTPTDGAFYSAGTDPLAAIDEGIYGDEYRENYYAWTWGDALFVVIDEFQYTMNLPYSPMAGEGSEPVTGDQWSWTLGPQQFQWLKQTLENSDAKYKFVFSHHMTGGIPASGGYVRGGGGAAPYFEWGGKNADGTEGFAAHRDTALFGTVPIHQMFVANGVSAYFHGHDHQYVYEKTKDGVVYQEVPSPGWTSTPFTGIYSMGDHGTFDTIKMLGNNGHLLITVTPAQATVDYISADAGTTGTSKYAYTIAPNTTSGHTVTFNANGGSGSMAPQNSSVPAALTLNAFTRAGYTFNGWNTIAGGTGTAYADGASYDFSADLTLYAQWTALPTHSVTFNSNGGSGTMAVQTSSVPAALTANAFTRTGYSFANWNTASNGSGLSYANGATYDFAADLALYAQWTANTYTVTFNANGGSTPSPTSKVVTYDSAYGALATTSRTGYTFNGWFTAAGGGTLVTEASLVTTAAAHSLYAQWTALPNRTVTFNSNGGTGTMAAQVSNVPAALTLNAFTRAGFSFANWNTLSNGTGTSYIDGATYDFSSDLTLYAQWSALPNHTVTFNANGGTGTMSNQVANIPTALTLNTFTRAGYSFAGWNTLSGGGGAAYTDGQTYSFSADLALYAQWTADTYTLTFDANGGSTPSPASKTVTYGSIYGALATTSRTGYTFNGWFTAAGGGTEVTSVTTVATAANHSLYAQWTALPNHTVTFNSNGGTGTMSPQTANVPTALTLNTFTRSGYTFANWNTTANGTGTSYSDGAVYPFAAEATLYAQWSALPTHTVTFNSNGGTGTMAPQISNVPAVLTLNTFTRSGYNFANWNTAANGTGTPYSDGASYPFAADATLYAQWSALPNRTVIFNSNGGTGSMSPQVANLPTALTLNTFTRSGYTFANWNTAANGTGTPYADGATYHFSTDITLYAQWTQGLVTYNIPLVSGWNLVSFNIHPSSTAVADVLATVAGNYSLAYAWDAAEASWMKYDPSQPFGNTLAALDETMGFWIKMSAAATLAVSGTAPTTSNIALESGWNLVGFPAQASLPLPEAFSEHGVGGDFNLVFAFHASDPGDPWKKYDPAAYTGNDLLELAHGWGYWVRAGGTHTWEVSY